MILGALLAIAIQASPAPPPKPGTGAALNPHLQSQGAVAGVKAACNPPDRHFDPALQPTAPIGSGTQYFVDGLHGSDTADGKTIATAWKTISRAALAQFAPGDTIRIKGGTYRESIFWRSANSGAAGKAIVIGAYGDSPVIIDASQAVSGWTLSLGKIFKAHPGFSVGAVVVDGAPLIPALQQTLLAVGQFFQDTTGDLYVWTLPGDSPALHDVGVLGTDPYRDGFSFNGAAHVTLYGVTIRFSSGHGVSVLGTDDSVQQSRILFNGNTGITLNVYNTELSPGTRLIKNEVAWNVMANWPRGRLKWCCWGMGISGQGVGNFVIRGNLVHNNGGEGIGAFSMAQGVIRDNVVYDNWSVNIYLDHSEVVDHNFVYCHDPNLADLTNNGDTNPSDAINLKHLRAQGIVTADETWPPKNLDPVFIRNNVVVNCRDGYYHWPGAGASAVKNVSFQYNTIVMPQNVISGETIFHGILIPYAGGGNLGSTFQNNVVYASNPSMYLLYSGDQPASGNGFVGLTMNHNLWFHSGTLTPIHWGIDYHTTYDMDLPHWQGLPGTAHGSGDLAADPKLTSTALADLANVLSKVPLPTSPVRGAAQPISVGTDYNFCFRPQGPGPDMGAFEIP